MDASVRGLPLLSVIPPGYMAGEEPECRRCKKEFGLFTRKKTCMHCGYGYCSTCCDHQALMPRERNTGDSGYDVVQVCAYCIDFLTLTAAGRSQLKLYSIPRLKGYLKAYGIPFPSGALEKDDFVQTILDAREANGCLSPAHENHYRRFSVPDGLIGGERSRTRNLFSRINDAFNPSQQQPGERVPPMPPHATRPSGSPSRHDNLNVSHSFPRNAAQSSREGQARGSFGAANFSHPNVSSQQPSAQQARSQGIPRSAPVPAPRPRSPPIPSLSDLLNLTLNELSALPSHTLKEVLHQNHVNARLILEKSDLVDKVKILLQAERIERQREEEARRIEDEVAASRQHRMMDDHRGREQQREDRLHHDDTLATEGEDSSSSGTAKQGSSSNNDTSPLFERQGLCVICQDAEANMATVDCGHLAMCMQCSELVMRSSRECPLCRTRIVTPERVIRIFRT